jgi:hypothetical protein
MPTTPASATRRPLAITLLAAYSLLIGVVTFIPQLYYVLFALNRAVFPIGPDANPLGALWYNYILGGHQGGYLSVDAGTLAGGLEDVFLLGPLYIATGVGLLRRSRWVRIAGLLTGAMGLYSILYFLLSGVIGQHDSTDVSTTILSTIPYLAYDLWLLATVLVRGSSLSPAQDAPAPAAVQGSRG